VDFIFEKIHGPFNSKERNFEELISQLLILEKNARPIEGSGGDEAVDCFTFSEEGGKDVYQVKYFLKRLTNSQRNQIGRSFKKAVDKHVVKNWILCIPINHTPSELKWFENLSDGSVRLEWWGETKIRTLLSKFPDVAKQFFKEDLIHKELKKFKSEIINTLTAIESTCWSTGNILIQNDIPFQYFNRVRDLCLTIEDDLFLNEIEQTPLIAIDFSELYSFFSSDTRYVTSIPIFDFCFKYTPFQFVILPATKIEIQEHIEYHRKTGAKVGVSRLETRSLIELLEAFFLSYEMDSNSITTHNSYNQIMMQLNIHGISASFRLPGLIDFVQKKVGFLDDDYSELYNNHRYADDIFSTINKLRPNSFRRRSNYIDAVNMSFIKNMWNAKSVDARMISSAPSFKQTAKLSIGEINPIRTSLEYAYLIKTLSFKETPESKESIKDIVSELKSLSKALSDLFSDSGLSGLIFEENIQKQYDALEVFIKFASHYRAILRPIDEMIISGYVSLPQMKNMKMKELYHFLKSEARVVDGFMKWWDQVAGILQQLSKIVPLNENDSRLNHKMKTIFT